MKYVMLIKDTTSGRAVLPEAERNEVGSRVIQWWNNQRAKGTIVAGHQLQPAHTATTVRIHAGKADVSDGPVFLTDGPYNESKETVGGYGLLEVANLDEALAVARSWPGSEATLELRPVIERG